MRIRNFTVMITIAVCLAIASQAMAKEVLKVNVLLSEKSEMGQAIKHMTQRVTELTKGEVEIQPFYSGALGKNVSVIMQSVAAGDMDGFIESGNYFGSLDKRFNVLDAPYAFKSPTQFQNFLGSSEFQDMASNIYNIGIKIVNSDRMNFLRAENRAVLTNSPVFTPDDLKKLKIRQYQAEMPIRGLMAMGANVQVIAWGDVYTALATGTVDGLETVLSQSIANKHVEVAKYHSVLSLYYQTAYVMIARARWDALSKSQQQAISTAVTEAGEVYNSASKKLRNDAIEEGRRDYGVSVIFPPLEPFQKLMEPAHKEWIKKKLLPAKTMEFIKTLPY